MTTLREQQRAAVKAAQGIIGQAQRERRQLTSTEQAALSQKNADVQRLAALIEESDADAKLMKSLEALGSTRGGNGDLSTALSFKGVADRILHGPDGDEPRNIKSLIAAGSQAVETTDVGLTVLKERPPVSFMESIPAEEVAENFSYLRQTTRTNNAAPVAAGGLKPTSIFTLTRVEGRLRVVAHISEPIPEYWLKDGTALKQFVNGEMVSGLAEAVAAQAITGDGVGENLAGIATTSGIQTQAFVTDIRENREPTPGLAEGIRTLEIVEEIYRQSGFPVPP